MSQVVQEVSIEWMVIRSGMWQQRFRMHDGKKGVSYSDKDMRGIGGQKVEERDMALRQLWCWSQAFIFDLPPFVLCCYANFLEQNCLLWLSP
jgi:hypothetical protein